MLAFQPIEPKLLVSVEQFRSRFFGAGEEQVEVAVTQSGHFARLNQFLQSIFPNRFQKSVTRLGTPRRFRHEQRFIHQRR